MNGPGATPRAAAPTPSTSGLLVVDKPAGPTSHDVVALVRRSLGTPGAGHLGTLDPPATGLLLVAVGAATRCITLWQGGEKTYEAAIRFGLETSTDDLAGERTGGTGVCPGEAAVRAATGAFVGTLTQVPPAVSAVKVGGRRLHELARAGQTVEPAPRRVVVHEWTWLEFRGPEALARIRCSGGTYVRALARDLGRVLGCGAALASLRRLRSEPFGLERGVNVEDLRGGDAEALWAKGGISLGDALRHLPSLAVSEAERARLAHGHPLARPAGVPQAGASDPRPAGAPPDADAAPAASVLDALGATRPAARLDPNRAIVLLDAAGTPLAVAERRADPRDPAVEWLQPRVVFPWTLAGAGS